MASTFLKTLQELKKYSKRLIVSEFGRKLGPFHELISRWYQNEIKMIANLSQKPVAWPGLRPRESQNNAHSNDFLSLCKKGNSKSLPEEHWDAATLVSDASVILSPYQFREVRYQFSLKTFRKPLKAWVSSFTVPVNNVCISKIISSAETRRASKDS